jgi:hypothetical protein
MIWIFTVGVAAGQVDQTVQLCGQARLAAERPAQHCLGQDQVQLRRLRLPTGQDLGASPARDTCLARTCVGSGVGCPAARISSAQAETCASSGTMRAVDTNRVRPLLRPPPVRDRLQHLVRLDAVLVPVVGRHALAASAAHCCRSRSS